MVQSVVMKDPWLERPGTIKKMTVSVICYWSLLSIVLCRLVGGKGVLISFGIVYINLKLTEFIPKVVGDGVYDPNIGMEDLNIEE